MIADPAHQFLEIAKARYEEVETLKRQFPRRWCLVCGGLRDHKLVRDSISHRYFRQCPDCGSLQKAE